MPTSTDFISNASAWASPFTSDALLITGILAGITIVFLLFSGLMGKVIGGVSRLTGRGRSGGRRRRR